MKHLKNIPISALFTIIFVSALIGAGFGLGGAALFFNQFKGSSSSTLSEDHFDSPTDSRQLLVESVKKVEPAVVSIVVTKDVQTFVRRPNDPFGNFFGDIFGSPSPDDSDFQTERREVGGGTGFFVSEDGLLITNKHVVSDEEASYTVLLNNGKRYEAKVVALDPANDIAVVKVEGEGEKFPVVELGDSDNLSLGESVIAVGNALGEFRNTVSVGVVSGLSRSVVASGSTLGPEQLSNVIQTDAAISSGNSGGPLANISGKVIGMNTAVSTVGENIGFAIPVNEIKTVLASVEEYGRVVRPFLGVRYLLVDEQIAENKDLSVKEGALLVGDANDPAVIPYGPADDAGLQEGDIILEISGEVVSQDNSLGTIIAKYSVGDKISLKVLRGEKTLELEAVLAERK